MRNFRSTILPAGVVLALVLGALVYRYISQPLLARSETAKFVCESRLLPTIKEAESVLNDARAHGGQAMPVLLREAKDLQMKLVEINQMIRDRARQNDSGGRALRDIAALSPEASKVFATSAVELSMRRCPDRASDRERTLKAINSIIAAVKSLPK